MARDKMEQRRELLQLLHALTSEQLIEWLWYPQRGAAAVIGSAAIIFQRDYDVFESKFKGWSEIDVVEKRDRSDFTRGELLGYLAWQDRLSVEAGIVSGSDFLGLRERWTAKVKSEAPAERVAVYHVDRVNFVQEPFNDEAAQMLLEVTKATAESQIDYHYGALERLIDKARKRCDSDAQFGS